MSYFTVAMLSQDRKTNRPLITALVLEFISRHLRRVPSSAAALERSEHARRDRDIVWYLLRGTIWESWTRYAVIYVGLIVLQLITRLFRPKLSGFADRTANTPVLGVLSAFLKDWIPLIDEYHYCGSSMIYT